MISLSAFKDFQMFVRYTYFVTCIALSFCVASPIVLAQTAPNNETVGSPALNAPKTDVTREQRQAAARERRAAGAQIAKEQLKDPSNNEAGKYGTAAPTKSTTREERVAARKERRAIGAQVARDNLKNPPNYEVGKPAYGK